MSIRKTQMLPTSTWKRQNNNWVNSMWGNKRSIPTRHLDFPEYCWSCCPGWCHFPPHSHKWSWSAAFPHGWSDPKWGTMSDWTPGCWEGTERATNAADASGSGFSLSGKLSLVGAWNRELKECGYTYSSLTAPLPPFFFKAVGSHVFRFLGNFNTFVLLHLGHPSAIPSSWCPLSPQPENPGRTGQKCERDAGRSLARCRCCSSESRWTHHREQTQRVEAPRRAGRQRFIPKVLQLLLSLMKNLQALGILVLQLSQLDERMETSEKRWKLSRMFMSVFVCSFFINLFQLSKHVYCYPKALMDKKKPNRLKREDLFQIVFMDTLLFEIVYFFKLVDENNLSLYTLVQYYIP